MHDHKVQTQNKLFLLNCSKVNNHLNNFHETKQRQQTVKIEGGNKSKFKPTKTTEEHQGKGVSIPDNKRLRTDIQYKSLPYGI